MTFFGQWSLRTGGLSTQLSLNAGFTVCCDLFPASCRCILKLSRIGKGEISEAAHSQTVRAGPANFRRLRESSCVACVLIY